MMKGKRVLLLLPSRPIAQELAQRPSGRLHVFTMNDSGESHRDTNPRKTLCVSGRAYRAGLRGRSAYDRNASGVWAVSIVGLLVIGRRTAARQLATLLPNLVRLFRALLRDPRVPRGSKVLLGF